MGMPRILVIDDEQGIVGSLVNYFSRKGYDVIGTTMPEDALVALGQGTFDLVITDLQMSPITGFEIIRIVKERYPKTLIIAMSGKYSLEEAGELGSDYFFAKPFLYKDMEEVIKERFALSQKG